VLIRLGDRWVLTDPVLGDRIGKFYPRKVKAGIDPRDLPDLTAVVVSHAHFDHLDVPSLRAVQPTPMLAPPGAVRFLPDGEQVGLDTWERWERDGLTITAVPASHGDGRYLVDRWVHDSHTGYVIEYGSLCVYFAGDTGWAPEQSEAIASKFDIDVALIPVGPAGRPKWVERWRMDVHVNPEMAMRLFAAVGAQWMVPIHYGTFYNDLARERPILIRAIEDSGVGTRVRVIGIGDTADFVY
jgi:N-acyl-phosphatidylethanolamine-hydrolysing phospholipase D